jgi:hypothetical protein
MHLATVNASTSAYREMILGFKPTSSLGDDCNRFETLTALWPAPETYHPR